MNPSSFSNFLGFRSVEANEIFLVHADALHDNLYGTRNCFQVIIITNYSDFLTVFEFYNLKNLNCIGLPCVHIVFKTVFELSKQDKHVTLREHKVSLQVDSGSISSAQNIKPARRAW